MAGLNLHKEELFEAFSIFSLILVVMISFALSMTLEANLFYIIIGFLPALLTIALAILFYEESRWGRVSVWVIPFLLIPAFYFVTSSQTLLSNNLDINTLLYLNIFVVGFFLVISFFLVKLLAMYK